MDEVRYLISDASKKVDVETHVLRYWEEELGLSIPRNELGHRYYTEFHVRLFCQVKKLKDKGYQLKAIKNALQQVMGTEQEQGSRPVAERDIKIREAASLLEQDITKALQSDPRLKGSLRLSLGKKAGGAGDLGDAGPLEATQDRGQLGECENGGDQEEVNPAAEDKVAAITYLSAYNRLETGVAHMGGASGIGTLERWEMRGKKEEKEVQERSDGGIGSEIDSEKTIDDEVIGDGRGIGHRRRIDDQKRADHESTAEDGKVENEKRIDDKEKTDAKKRVDGEKKADRGEKAEKDGRMDMKNKRKDRKKPSAWERRNGVVSGTQIKGEDTDGVPRKEAVRCVGAKQEEIVSRAVRKEGAGKACVERILEGKAEAEWEAWPIDQVIDGTRAHMAKDEAGEDGLGDAEIGETGAGSGGSAGPEGRKREHPEPEEAQSEDKDTVAAVSALAEQEAAVTALAEQEAAVAVLAVQQDIEDTDKALITMTQEEKLEQFQKIMDHIIGRALEVNNEKLSQDISRLVNDELVGELSDLMRIRDEREEERFRRLDETIRSCQRDRLGKAEAAATRIPFFRRKRYGRNGSALV